MLDSKIRKLKDYFGISTPEDWQDVSPEMIRSVHGCGDATVDHIRVWLAMRNLTLKGDHTPAHWRDKLPHIKIGHEMGDDDNRRVSPFAVIIDTAETQPFPFHGIPDDRTAAGTFVDAYGDRQQRTLEVPILWQSLGRFPNSLGDYSIEGGIGRVHVERKSMEDLQSTILGWKKDSEDGSCRRERFESELANLSKVEAGCVMVECNFLDVVKFAPEWGVKTQQQNAKSLFRSIVAYQQDYGVHWCFAGTRRVAEVATYRWFARWWDKRRGERKEMEKLIAAM